MNSISNKIGLWSSVVIFISFIAWIISFVGIAATSPLFIWTNINDYVAYVNSNSHFFQNMAMFFMLIFGPAYLLMINSYSETADEKHKILVKISTYFALAFAITSCIHYFVQLSFVRLNLNAGNFAAIEPFVQANPLSVMTSIVMLGWTFFLGLSSVFLLPVFGKNRNEKFIKAGFLINSVSCLFGLIGYMFKIDILTFIFVNLGIGGAILTVSVSSLKFFKIR